MKNLTDGETRQARMRAADLESNLVGFVKKMIGRTPTRIRLAFGAAGASDARSADGLAGTSTQRRAQSCCKRWIRQVGGDSHRTGSVFLKVFVLEFFEFCELLVSVVLVGRVVGWPGPVGCKGSVQTNRYIFRWWAR